MSIAFSIFTLVTVIAGLMAIGALRGTTGSTHAAKATSTQSLINCASNSRSICAEVFDSEKVFGEGVYVGHDEPSTLFYSNRPGSGNQMRYTLTLPSDPAPTPLVRGKSFNFQLHPAFWFGMAMCDTQSYPELLRNCTPDSDTNIVDPSVSPRHAGTAFMEMQFYPPGWVPFQNPGGISCDARKWCAAFNIDSLGLNSFTNQANNNACLSTVGIETVNFAFITRNGIPQAPPAPVNQTSATFTPDPNLDLFMNSGDRIVVTMHDTASGLRIDLNDTTTGQSGFMVSSAANGFGQVKFDPTGTTCQNIPYDFHPMYSTSSELTRVPWTAHSYNVAFSDEIGHWDYCNGPNSITPAGRCPQGNFEGISGDHEGTDRDDSFCYPTSFSTLVPVSGCANANDPGFDGTSYQADWPDGNTMLHPTSVKFTSPLTGSGYNVNYPRVAFEADLPRIEIPTCNRASGVGCTLIPTTDDGIAAVFYPFYSIGNFNGGCVWRLGSHIPGSINDFGQNNQYGQLLNLTYSNPGGHPFTLLEDFRQILSSNPCKAN
jgi:hypothetical protein